MNIITSNQNSIVKEVRCLRHKKDREEKGLFFIEGVRFVEEALKEKVDIDKILISDKLEQIRGGKEILSLINTAGKDVYLLSDKLFRELSDTENPQGILATIKYKKLKLDEILNKGNFYIILDSLQDPGNMGTIMRTADAAGASGVIISKGCVDLYNPKVLRSTMGAIFHIPICFTDNLIETIAQLKTRGIRIYAAHLKGEANYFEVDMRKDVAIIIGNEANGISEEVAAYSDMLIKIPMPGRAESLNASVAASILMYEVVRQRCCGAGLRLGSK